MSESKIPIIANGLLGFGSWDLFGIWHYSDLGFDVRDLRLGYFVSTCFSSSTVRKVLPKWLENLAIWGGLR